MKIKKTFLIPTAVLALVLLIVMTGFYPVALVDGSPIYFRAWRKLEEAQKKYTNAQAKSVGLKSADFSSAENKEISLTIKKEALTSLIEDRIMEQEGDKVIAQFAELSQKRLEDTVSGNENLDKAVRTVYALSFSSFKNLILLPQSRRDVLRVFLAGQGKNFEEWLKDAKSQKSVKLYFVPFRWNGDRVR